MDKYIGFDMACKKTVACVVQQGKKDAYRTLKTDVQQMQAYLQELGKDGSRLHLTFEISGQAAYYYDSLKDYVDTLAVSNPHTMTWIYRTRKKNDRIDARKQAVLLSIGEIPKVHIPHIEVRQWRTTIQHRYKTVNRIVSIKNSIRALIKAHGIMRPLHKGSWWKKVNIQWMRELSIQDVVTTEDLWLVQLSNLLDTLQLLQEQQRNVTNYLDRYLHGHPGGTLLMSIPGIGPRTAEAVLAPIRTT
jgi:transposase